MKNLYKICFGWNADCFTSNWLNVTASINITLIIRLDFELGGTLSLRLGRFQKFSGEVDFDEKTLPV